MKDNANRASIAGSLEALDLHGALARQGGEIDVVLPGRSQPLLPPGKAAVIASVMHLPARHTLLVSADIHVQSPSPSLESVTTAEAYSATSHGSSTTGIRFADVSVRCFDTAFSDQTPQDNSGRYFHCTCRACCACCACCVCKGQCQWESSSEGSKSAESSQVSHGRIRPQHPQPFHFSMLSQSHATLSSLRSAYKLHPNALT